MTLRLPVIKQQWCLEAIDTHYQASLTRDRLRTKKSSSNSPFASQPDVNTSGSYSQAPGEANDAKPPPQTAAAAAAAAATTAAGNDSFRSSLERKLERERERRTRGETPATRPEPKVLPEETAPVSTAMDVRRNGYRLSSNGRSPGLSHQPPPAASSMTSTTAAAAPVTSSLGGGSGGGGYRTTSNRDALASMGSLTVAATPSSAALRGRSIGFGSREAGAGLRSPTQRGKVRGGTVMPLAVHDKAKNARYSFLDPVPSASPSFQQRLSELAALESDTIRYERTKRIKKRSKQEGQ